MVALMNETDIDRFIREQKSKLENERNNFMVAKDDSRSILQLGQYENHRKKLQEERFNDYNNYLQNKKSYQKEPLSVKSKSHEQLHVQNLEEQLKELQKTSTGKFFADTEQPHRSTWSSLSQKSQPKKKEPDDFFANFGEYENTKKKLKEERERDYHRHLAEFLSKKSQPRKKESDDFFANFSEYKNTKKKLNEERERDFDRHFAENTNRGDSPLANGKQLSNRENRIMWADQAYGKQSAPPLYRGDADYNYDYPFPKLNTAANEGTSNKYDISLKDLANEYSARLSQPNLHEEIENRLRPMASTFSPVSNNFLDDPLWARLRENPQEIGLGPQRSTFVMPDDYMRNPLNNVERNNSKFPYTPTNQLFITEPVPTHTTHLPKKQTETYATLPIGNNQESEKQRQKHNYREELQKQMQERNALRLREKQLAKSPFFPLKANPSHPVPPLEFQSDYHSQPINPRKFEHLQHDSGLNQFLGPNFDQHQRQNLNNNFSPNFMYDQLHFNGPNNPIDKAYTFYGMKDHFDDIPPPANGMNMFTPSMKKPAEYVPQTSYSSRPSQKSPVQFGPSAMMFGNDDFNSSVKKREDYMKALEVQMQEKKLKKLKAKQDQDRYDKRLEEENKQYNPFGRGGGGAPLKDSSGNVIANLRQMKQNDFKQPASLTQTMSPTAVPPIVAQSQKLDKENIPGTLSNVNEESNNARGGHGIFGEPKTDAQKTAKEKYLEDLQKQMLDKKNQKLAEAEKERLEEEKMNKQLEEQRKKMQEEFEEEERKRKAKIEEKRKAEEEMRRQIEEKKKEAKRLRKEENEKRRNEENHPEKIKTEAPPIVHNRPKSPPVPALQRKLKLEARSNSGSQESESPVDQNPGTPETTHKRSKSPPVPALQSKMKLEARTDSERQKLSPLSSDDQSPRTPETNAAEILEAPSNVFSNASRVSPDIVEALTFASPDVLHDFNQLTYRKQTESRNAFRNQFPDSPRDRATLEFQQRALINRQEKNLQKYRKNGSLRTNNEHDHPPLLRQKTVSPQPLLDSKSSFFDADSMPLLSDVFSENRVKRPDSARLRRRLRLQSPQLTLLDGVSLRSNSADSLMSLNADKIARKNEARLKKLQTMTDGVSLTEPEDILDKFMAKQNRSPPSSLFDGFN